jgi:hypothetical protein
VYHSWSCGNTVGVDLPVTDDSGWLIFGVVYYVAKLG